MVANAFVWYLSGFSYLQDVASMFGGNSVLIMVAANFTCLVISGLTGSLLTGRFSDRLTFLKYWVLTGVILSFIFPIVNVANLNSIIILASILGVYFGIGMPICMGYYAKSTEPQNRAKLGGIIILLIGIGFPLISIIGGNGVTLMAGSMAAWRVTGLIFVLPMKTQARSEQKEKVTYRSVISNRTFLFYAAPWLMFSLINDLTIPLNEAHFSTSIFGEGFMFVGNVVAGASAVICGILADKKGRKRLALLGFALLGVGYASLGLFGTSNFANGFYIVADGIAWGIFSMLFLVTIWGDIAHEKSSEKFYFLGVLPYLFSNLTRLLAGDYIATNMLESTVFSFASFFLFLAILPLAYAPETLPDKIIKNLDINSYVNKALEKAKKDKAKSAKAKTQQKNQTSHQETNETSSEYEEAKKLAEKYY